MFTKGSLLPKYAKKIKSQTKLEGENKLSEVKAFIDESLRIGGKGFVERCRKFATTEKGFDFIIDDHFAELLELIGDLRISHVCTSGAAQVGKTASNTLFFIDTVVNGLNCAWAYASATSLQNCVREQFSPMAKYWVEKYEKETGKALKTPSDIETLSRFQIGKATAIFTYSSTSRSTKSREGLAAVGGVAASFSSHLLVIEESSQHPIGVKSVLPRRLDAGLIPSFPIRELGTPGNSQGIEKEFETCSHIFYPHATCEHCGSVAKLDPKGSLLREIDITDSLGRAKKSFFSASGRPVKWFFHDENEPILTAFIGCSVCHRELSQDTRINSHYRCLKTQQSLRDYLDSLPLGVPRIRQKVAIILSPLLRRSRSNLAQEIIQDGLSCDNPNDYQQQRLGWASETEVNSLTLDILEKCIGAPDTRLPAQIFPKEFVLAGIDPGRGQDWVAITRFILPIDYKKLTTREVIEKTKRAVLFAGDVIRDDIPDLLDQYGTEHGLMDNEPDRESNFKLAEKTCLDLADQRAELMQMYKKSVVLDGGKEIPVWLIRDSRFKSQLFDSFLLQADDGYPLYRLPLSWERWKNNPSALSPLRHLMSVSKSDKGWQRPADHVDDIFMSLVFCEASFYLQLEELGGNLSWVGMA